jgi:hypothetical protein
MFTVAKAFIYLTRQDHERFRCKFSRERSRSQSDGSWIGRDDRRFLSVVTQTIVRATNPVLAVSSR